MDFQNFWREHLTWYLSWVANEIKQLDPNHGLHVNPHALIDIPAKYQLPEWKVFLSSLGASIHPVWHFNSLTRSQFPLGVSYVCDLVRGASDPNPFWVTELQGGHNIYSANTPLVPTTKEIYSWLWTSIGSGAEKTIFWCLNQRSQGTEAGEWGMVDYADQPTERLLAANEVAKTALSLKDFWQNAYPAQPEITLLFSPETVFLQERSAQKDEHPARGKQAHQLSLLSVYQALASSGITPAVKYLYDYEWFAKTAKPRLVVAPHITSLSDQDLLNMKNFVEQGGKLVVTGLTGMFDGYEKTRWMKKSVFDELVGDRVLEVMEQGTKGSVSFSGTTGKMVSPYFWLKTQKSSKPENYPLVHKLGKGEVIWIPAMVDVGNWPTPALAYQTLWQQLAAPYRTGSYGFGFITPQTGVNIRVMENANQYLTVITNTGKPMNNVPLKTPAGVNGSLYFKSGADVLLTGKNLTLPKGETAVILWKQG
jgi:beta-galactosidase